jgi:hypothetical protein
LYYFLENISWLELFIHDIMSSLCKSHHEFMSTITLK